MMANIVNSPSASNQDLNQNKIRIKEELPVAKRTRPADKARESVYVRLQQVGGYQCSLQKEKELERNKRRIKEELPVAKRTRGADKARESLTAKLQQVGGIGSQLTERTRADSRRVRHHTSPIRSAIPGEANVGDQDQVPRNLKGIYQYLTEYEDWPQSFQAIYLKGNKLFFEILRGKRDELDNFLKTHLIELDEEYMCVQETENTSIDFYVAQGEAIAKANEETLIKMSNKDIKCVTVDEIPEQYYGTVSFIARDKIAPNKHFVVTARHNFFQDRENINYICDDVNGLKGEFICSNGERIGQIATVSYGIYGLDEKNPKSLVDISVVPIDTGNINPQDDVSIPQVLNGENEKLCDIPVQAKGVMTPDATGRIDSVQVRQMNNVKFHNCITIVPEGKLLQFCLHGDSGALVTANIGGVPYAIGILSFGLPVKIPGEVKKAVAVRLDKCLVAISDRFGLDLELSSVWNEYRGIRMI